MADPVASDTPATNVLPSETPQAPLTLEAFGRAVRAEFAKPLAEVRSVIEGYAQSHELTLEEARRLLFALQAAERLAQRCETLGTATVRNEPLNRQLVDLEEVFHEMLEAYNGRFDEMNLDVRATLKSVQVLADRAKVHQLAAAMAEWAIENGRRIVFLARPAAERPNPVQPYLQVTVHRDPGTENEPSVNAMGDSLSWRLISTLADRLGVTPVRIETEAYYRIQVPFPRENPEVLAQHQDPNARRWWE